MKTLLIVGTMLMLATAVEARRYVGKGPFGEVTVVSRTRWRPVECTYAAQCWTLRARYRCRGAAVLCPNLKPGRLLGQTAGPGDFSGWLSFRDGSVCQVSGSLTSREPDIRLWTDPPQQAPRMAFALECGEDSYGFIGEAP